MSESKEVKRWWFPTPATGGLMGGMTYVYDKKPKGLSAKPTEVVEASAYDALRKERDDYLAALLEIKSFQGPADRLDEEMHRLACEALAKHEAKP